jgi:hypothetical protein
MSPDAALDIFTLRRVQMDFEGYCVKCREKREVTDGEVKETPNGRRMVQGECPVCSTKVTRFLPSEKKEEKKG